MANHIELRCVIVRQSNGEGGFSEQSKIQYRTKEITASVLGLLPLSAAWTAWTDMGAVTVVMDELGNILP